MKKAIWIIIPLGLALLCTLFLPSNRLDASFTKGVGIIEKGLFEQDLLGTTLQAKKITKLYQSGKFIGVVSDYNKIEKVMDEAYQERYKADFPKAKLGLGEDIYETTEYSYQNFADIDDQICDYLKTNDLFSVEVPRIEFSNGAVVFVKDVDMFNEARDQYLTNYISKNALDLIRAKKVPAELQTYGSRETAITIKEKMTVSKGLAPASKILKDKNEVIYYLSYGDDREVLNYTVEEEDTIEGVASKNGLPTAEQVVIINNEVLKSVDQVLAVGQVLNVKPIASPITVVVQREVLKKEIVYPEETIYQEDPTLREGLTRTIQEAVNGYANTKVLETYINGVVSTGVVTARNVILQPQQEIIERGTKVIPGIGSGSFRWPVNNPRITCNWGCYYGHQGVDIQNAYNKWDEVIASDRGTVIENSWHYISGYYVVIDHNNGYTSHYGHMKQPGFYGVGVNVEKGEVIGKIGMTGYATGPHVHFFITKNGSRVNPCNGYLPC